MDESDLNASQWKVKTRLGDPESMLEGYINAQIQTSIMKKGWRGLFGIAFYFECMLDA